MILHLQIVLEALPKDETNQGRRYRGYVAIDNLVFEHGDVSIFARGSIASKFLYLQLINSYYSILVY